MPQNNIYGKCTWSRFFSLDCFLKTLIIDIDLKQKFQLLLSNRRRSGCGRCWVPSLTDTGWISCWSPSVAPTSGSSTWLRASPTPGAPVFLPSKNHEAKCREYLKSNADLYFKTWKNCMYMKWYFAVVVLLILRFDFSLTIKLNFEQFEVYPT